MSPNQKSSSSKAKSEKAKKTSPRQKVKKAMGKNMSRFSFMQRAKDFLNVANDKLHDVVENMKTRLSEQTEKQSQDVNSRVATARPVMSTSSGKSQSSARP